MTPEQQAAYIMAEAMILFATISGMTAENMQRQVLGESMAYTHNDFEVVIGASGGHPQRALEPFRS